MYQRVKISIIICTTETKAKLYNGILSSPFQYECHYINVCMEKEKKYDYR